VEHDKQLHTLRHAVSDLRSHLQEVKVAQQEFQVFENLISASASTGQFWPETQGPIPTGAEQGALRALRHLFDVHSRETRREIFEIRKELMVIRQAQADAKAVPVTEKVVELPVPTLQIPQRPSEATLVHVEGDDGQPPRPPDLLDVIPLSVPSPEAHEIHVPRVDRKDEMDSGARRPSPSTPDRRYREPQRIPPLAPPLPSPRPTADEPSRPLLRPVKQQIEELLVMTPNDEIEARMLHLIIDIRSQLQLQVDQNTTRLNALDVAFPTLVDRDYVAKFFSKVRATLNEISNQITVVRQSIPDRVTKSEMQDSLEEVVRFVTQGNETSGGATSYKCLLCGREKKAIAGMISDARVAEALGDPPEAIAGLSRPNSGARGTMLYGTDKQLYRGRGNLGRPLVASALEPKRPLPPIDRKS
jgi:hypothetical protein